MHLATIPAVSPKGLDEAYQRTNVQHVLGGEQAGVGVLYAVTVDVSTRWRGVRVAQPIWKS